IDHAHAALAYAIEHQITAQLRAPIEVGSRPRPGRARVGRDRARDRLLQALAGVSVPLRHGRNLSWANPRSRFSARHDMETPGVDDHTTQDDLAASLGPGSAREPGLVLVFSGMKPLVRVRLFERGRIEMGRENLPDDRLSRKHAELHFNASGCQVRDLASRNGTFVEGIRVTSAMQAGFGSVIR